MNQIAIIATLVTNIVTNWTQSPVVSTTLLFPPEANKVTHYENGSVVQETQLIIEFEGKQYTLCTEQKFLRTLTRSYIEQSVKVYTEARHGYHPFGYYGETTNYSAPTNMWRADPLVLSNIIISSNYTIEVKP